MPKRHVVVGASLAVAVGVSASLALLATIARPAAASDSAGPARVAMHTPRISAPKSKFRPAKVSEATSTAGTTSYPSEGVTIAPAASGYTPATSASAVLASFKDQPVPQGALGATLTSSQPNVTLNLVTESSPTYPGLSSGVEYPAWVVTYPNTTPVYYGPVSSAATPSPASCAWVGIYDLQIGAWTTYFQDCS